MTIIQSKAVIVNLQIYYTTSAESLLGSLLAAQVPIIQPLASANNLPRNLLLLPQRALNVPLGILFGGGFAFVVLLFTFAEADQQLCITVARVNLQRHDRVAFLLRLAEQLGNLLLMKQQLARTRWIGRVMPVALLERTDMHIVNEHFTVPDRRKSIVDVRFAVPNRLDLRTREHDARFVRLFDKIIMGRLLILRERLVVVLLAHAYSPFNVAVSSPVTGAYQRTIVATLCPESKTLAPMLLPPMPTPQPNKQKHTPHS